MIAPAIVDEIKRLLAQGKWSGRKIARMTGVSRGTVASIAQGNRPDYEALRAERKQDEEPLGPLGRCPKCGGKVHLPCRLCRLRRMMARSTRRQRLLGPDEPMQLQLREEHRIRYEQVRAQRIAAEQGREERGEGREGGGEGKRRVSSLGRTLEQGVPPSPGVATPGPITAGQSAPDSVPSPLPQLQSVVPDP